MEKQDIKKILIIRFRQIGDSILAAAMCSSLKRSFPNAQIHMVLNERISPIFHNHPDIDKIISFTPKENEKFFLYLGKIWNIMRAEKYDVIIDMRSTIRTLIFSLFSLGTPIRIGKKKKYTFLLNRTVAPQKGLTDMVHDNQLFANELSDIAEIIPERNFRLYVTNEEKEQYRSYMQSKGIDFSHPVILLGITTKIPEKRWNIEYMKEVVRRILHRYNDKKLQLIFNYAPGREEEECRQLYKELGNPDTIKIDIRAGSVREFMALCSNSSFYFGNEGGGRHLVQALGIPSYAIFSPGAAKYKWLPQNSTPAQGICVSDVLTDDEKASLTIQEQFDSITPDIVWRQLTPMLDAIIK